MVPGWLFFTVPGGFFGYSWFQVGHYGSRLVLMVFQGSRWVFHGFS